MTAAAAPHRFAWRAVNRSGAGHCFPRKPLRAPALCGMPNQAEAFDWPRNGDCADCRLAYGALMGNLGQ